MLNFDLSDPFFADRDLDRAFRISKAPKRALWQLRQRDSLPLQARFRELGAYARVRDIAAVFGWSKPTVMKFVRLGLLKRRRKWRGVPRRPAIELDVESAISLVGLCHRTLQGDERPLNGREHSRIRARIEAQGVNRDYHLPERATVGELAHYLRCTHTSVLRMIQSGMIDAYRRTPRRWEIKRKTLPWWCFEKK